MHKRLLLATALLVALISLAFVAPVSADSPTPTTFSDLIVRFRPGIASAQINQILAARGLTQAEYDPDLDVSRVRPTRGANLNTALAALRQDARVAFAEPNYIVQAAVRRENYPPLFSQPNAGLPNDPLFQQQWGLQRIQAPRAWDYVRGNPLTVGVIDSGIDLTHPDLRAHLVKGFNFVNPGTLPQDFFGHGTHVAGIIGAVQNNHIGIAGTAPNVNLMPLQILDENGEGTLENLGKAIHYAALKRVRVVNMSLGTFSADNRCPQSLQEQINLAYARGVLLVAAAGNQGGTTPYFPAACAHVIAVTSSDVGDGLSFFDNTGPWIDLAAPGEGILSTFPGNDYEYADGTSMASPFVAGTAVMVWTRNPNASPDEVEHAMESTADRFGRTTHNNGYGWGRLNAARAVGGR